MSRRGHAWGKRVAPVWSMAMVTKARIFNVKEDINKGVLSAAGNFHGRPGSPPPFLLYHGFL